MIYVSNKLQPALKEASIYMGHAYPMVVPVNTCASDFIKLLQLIAADLAYFPIWNLDLGVVTKNHNHLSILTDRAKDIKLSAFESVPKKGAPVIRKISKPPLDNLIQNSQNLKRQCRKRFAPID